MFKKFLFLLFALCIASTPFASDFGAVSYTSVDATSTLTASVNTSATLDDGVEFNDAQTAIRLAQNLPSATNKLARVIIGKGTGVNDYVYSSHTVHLPNGKWRKYASYNNGTYARLSYWETTDTEIPSETNLGDKVDLGIGTAANASADFPFVVTLDSGYHRLYYGWSDGTFKDIYYVETTTTDYPNADNLGSPVALGMGTDANNWQYTPHIKRRASDNKYFIYFTYYDGTFYQLGYRITTDTNAPGAANLGAKVNLGIGTDASNYASAPFVIQRPDGEWNIYYNWVTTYGMPSYQTTNDGNLPDETNLGTRVDLGMATGASDSDQSPEILKTPDGKYRMYTDYLTTYHRFAYRDSYVDIGISPVVFGKWKWNGDTNDSSYQHNNSGSLLGHANITSGYLAVDGTDDAFKVGDVLDTFLTGADKKWSIYARFYLGAVGAYQAIVAKTSATGNQRCLSIRVNDSNYLNVVMLTADGSQERQITASTTALQINTWYDLIITYDGSLDTNDGLDRVHLYLANSEETRSVTTTTGALFDLPNTTAPLSFGGQVQTDDSITSDMNGRVGTIIFYDHVLTSAERAYVTANQINEPFDFIADPIFLVDSADNNSQWNFAEDVINENPDSETGTLLYQWSVDNGTRSWNGTYLTKATLATVATQTGRYKAIKTQLTSDGTQDASLAAGTFTRSGSSYYRIFQKSP